jgi:hypothetical protein
MMLHLSRKELKMPGIAVGLRRGHDVFLAVAVLAVDSISSRSVSVPKIGSEWHIRASPNKFIHSSKQSHSLCAYLQLTLLLLMTLRESVPSLRA